MSVGTRAAALGACVLWAVSFVATKVALEAVPALTLVSLRLLVASLCFLPLLMTRDRRIRLATPTTLVRLLWLSVLGVGLHHGSQTVGLQFTTASNASVYVATGPIFILLLAAVMLGERLTSRKVLGVGIALTGVLVVMGVGTITGFDLTGHLLGDVLVLLSLFVWGLFTVLGKKITEDLGAVTVVGATTVLGAVWMAPIGWFEMRRTGFELSEVPGDVWIAILFLGIGCNFVATLLYFVALARTESQKVGVYLYAVPPITAVVASLFLGEVIGPNLIAGAFLVIGGVALTERG